MHAQRARANRRWLASAVAAVSVFFLLVAFMKISDSNPLETGFTKQSVFEIGCLGMGTLILFFAALTANVKVDLTLLFSPTVGLTWLFVVWSSVTAFWANSPLLDLTKGLELLCLTIDSLLVITFVKEYAKPESLENIIVFVCAAIVVLFLGVNVLIWHTPFPFTTDPEGRARFWLGRTFPLTVADLTGLAFLAAVHARMPVWLKAAAAGGFGLVLWLTDARGPTLAVLLAVLIYVAWRSPLLFCTGILPVGLAGLWLNSDAVARSLQSVMSPDVNSLNGRTDLWEVAMPLVWEHPLGVGYYNTRFVLLDVVPWAGHAHNSFLETALSTGLFGVTFLISFLAYGFIRAVRARDQFLVSVLVYCAIAGFLNPLLFVPGIPMIIVLLAMGRAEVRGGQREGFART